MFEKLNLWTQKKNKIILCIAAVMVVVFIVSFISYFKIEEERRAEEYKPYDDMYNASRYFFRIYYPQDWDINTDPYGFLLDEEGLVMELFPLKKIAATPGVTKTPSPTAKATASTSPSATVDPRAGMERNDDLTVKIYYKEYGNLADAIKPTTSAPSASPEASQAKRVELVDLAEYLFDDFKAEKKDAGYNFTAARTQKGDTIEFCVLPYTFVKDDIRMTGEMYVASRSMAYYVIYVEGVTSKFAKYDSVVKNMMYNLKFSVFDD